MRARQLRALLAMASSLNSLPTDVLRKIFRAVADPLQPAGAGALASTCGDIHHAVRSRAAGADRSEVERLRLWWGRATALCGANRMTRAQLAAETRFDVAIEPGDGREGVMMWSRFHWMPFAAADAAILGHLMARGSVDRIALLNLMCASLEPGDMQPILNALSGGALPRLHSLLLNGNSLGDRFCMSLAASARAAGVLQALRFLNMCFNGITGKGVTALAGALAQGALPRLSTLDLRCNQVDDAGVEALAESGKQGCRALSKLSLARNSITPVGIDALAAALDKGAFPALECLSVPTPVSQLPRIKEACEKRHITLADQLA